MTITREVTSAQSGWVYDGYTASNGGSAPADGIVWRYGTERACNLVGRYVSIVADYSTVTPPYEISLCQWAIMGGPAPPVEEEEVIEPEVVPEVELVTEPVVSTISEVLVPQHIILGESISWVLPEVITSSESLKRVEVVPDFLLKNFIEYNDETKSVEYSGPKTVSQLKTGVYWIKITLIDEDGSSNEYK